MAERARASFNQRFWYAEGGHLYDIVDCDGGRDDPACRPNQILAVSLPDPVLDRALSAGGRRCASSCSRPWGCDRSRARTPTAGRATTGIRTRDAAYHQGTIWSWLIGPFVDAWLKVHGDRAAARACLDGLVAHLGEASSVRSRSVRRRAPLTPRGCVAQAWGVAELLRALLDTEG